MTIVHVERNFDVGDGYWYILDDICSSQCKKKNGIRESKKTYPVLNI